MLLILDNSQHIATYLHDRKPYKYLDVSELSLVDALKEIRQLARKHSIAKIYFPIELKFKNKLRQSFGGLELLKHIRLTPDLGKNVQFASILVGYTYPLESILRDSESTILCAPATYLFNLKNVTSIDSGPFWDEKSTLTKDNLKPYILYTDADEGKSDHDRRNKEGPIKLERELNGDASEPIDLALWKKKVLFLQQEVLRVKSNVSDVIGLNKFNRKKICYLDDDLLDWIRVLKEVFKGADLDGLDDYDQINKHFENLKQKQSDLISYFREIEEEIEDILSRNRRRKNHQYLLLKSKLINIINELASLIVHDLVILDLRLNKTLDNDRSVNMLSGVVFLDKIREINPFIPVLIFTASGKIDSYKAVIEKGASDIWIKNISSANDLERKALALLANRIEKRGVIDLKKYYAKYWAIKSKSVIKSIVRCERNQELTYENISDVKRDRINESVQYFISFFVKILQNPARVIDLRELWKVTGGLIEIRIPAISEKSMDEIKTYSNVGIITNINREFDYKVVRNYFVHNESDGGLLVKRYGQDEKLRPYDISLALEYIDHTFEFLLDHR